MAEDRSGEILARLDALQREEAVLRERSHVIVSALTAIKLGVEELVNRLPAPRSPWSEPITTREVSLVIGTILSTIGVLKFFGKV